MKYSDILTVTNSENKTIGEEYLFTLKTAKDLATFQSVTNSHDEYTTDFDEKLKEYNLSGVHTRHIGYGADGSCIQSIVMYNYIREADALWIANLTGLLDYIDTEFERIYKLL